MMLKRSSGWTRGIAPALRGGAMSMLTAATLVFACAGCSRTPLLSPEPLHECVAVAPEGPSSQVVSATVDIDRSDVLFLIDNSSSMVDEIERIRSQLTDVLVPEIRARVTDAQFGVAVFSDFGEREVGERSHPYQLLQPITGDVHRVLDAVERIELEYGGDNPESHLEALYQAATGEGLGIYVDEGPECAEDTRAGVCFRPESFAIVMLFSDAPMRNVVGITETGMPSPVELEGEVMNEPFIPYLRGYDETLDALLAAGIRVVGLWSGRSEGIDDMRRMARDTGALDLSGQPIVFEIGTKGEALGASVIRGLELITAGAQHEVWLELEDARPEDGVDPRTLVTMVRALRADPQDGGQPSGDHFTGVRAGTTVYFEVTFDASSLPQSALEQRYPLGLRIRASDGTLLSGNTIDVVVAAQSDCPTPAPP